MDEGTREPSAADSLAASRAFLRKTAVDLAATGFHKPLPPMRRLGRLWTSLGLLLGRQLATVVRDDHVFLILMAAVVGVTSGLASGALLAWIEYAIGLFPKPDEANAWVRWAAVVLVPVAGGLAAGALLVALRRFVRQPVVKSVPGVIEAVATRGGTIRGRQAVVVGAGTGITIGSGGSCGFEGPSVAIGAAVGSVLGRFFGLRLRRQLAMVGAGCAGGLAAAFNAPLAGVIFTVEIVFGGAIGGDVGTMSVFVPLIVAAVAGTFTSHAIRGAHPAFELTGHAGASVAELGFYVVLAIAAGVIGTAMGRAVVASSRRFEALPLPIWVKPAIGALGVGVLAAVVSNELLGAGHSTVARALRGDLAWQLALALCLLKIVATSLTVGSGGFGGVFMPSLYVGATLGTAVGALAELVLGPGGQGPGGFALVGMGAIFAATMHAPLTPIVMIFELTQDYGIIMPLMLGCILAVFVARRVHPNSFARMSLLQRGVVLEREAEGEVMKRHLVRDLIRVPDRVLTQASGLEEIRHAALDSELRATFVVDDDGAVVGYINGNQLARRMLAGEITPDSTARDLMGTHGLALLYATDTLAGAMLASARSGMEILPVVDEGRRLVGVLRRGDLLAHYSDNVLGEQEQVVQIHTGTGAPDQEVGLGKGLILERIVVGRAWAGKSLAELELRNRTGCTVLEWTRGESTMPVDPRAPLREGDILAVAGTREQILRARRLH